ncbi:MAG TPA: autotransporter-associated beta strand repeat-containing protein, partial [Gemmataceae bacterium]
ASGTSFTGNVTVSAGLVTFAGATGGDLFENITTLTVAPGATFDFAANGETFGGIAGGGTIQSTGTAVSLTLVGAVDQTWAGTLTNTITTLAKNNNSNYVVTGANNYTGATTINGGSIRLVDNGTLAGTTGAFTLGAGARLILDNTGAANINNRVNSVVTVTSNGGEIALRGAASGTSSQSFGAITLGANTGSTVTVDAGGSQASITFAGLTRNAGSAVLVRGQNLGAAPGPGVANVFVTAAPATLLVGGGVAGTPRASILPFAVADTNPAGFGTTFATYDVNGVRPVNVATEYAPYAAAGPLDNARVTAAATGLVGKTINTLAIDNSTGGGFAVTGTAGTALQPTSNAILVTGTAPVTLGGFDFLATYQNLALIHVPNTGGLVLTSPIAVEQNGLTKTGPGPLTLPATTLYGGDTNILGGTLRPSAANSLPAQSDFTIAPGATLDLNNLNQTVGSLASAGHGNNAFITLGSATLTVGGTNAGTSFAGVISGTGGLTKIGPATQAIQQAQTYTGPTVILGGALNVSSVVGVSHGSLQTSAITVANGGQLSLNTNIQMDRVPDGTPITLGGNLNLSAPANTAVSETMGTLTVAGGGAVFTQSVSGTLTNTLTFGSATIPSLGGRASGATLTFPTTAGTSVVLPNVSAGQLNNGILGGWAVKGDDWAAVPAGGGTVAPFAGYVNNDDLNAAAATDHVQITGAPPALTASRAVNTVKFASTQALDLGGNTLTVNGGGILAATAAAASITNGTLTAGNAALNADGRPDLVLVSQNTTGLTVSAVIADNGAPTGLTKAGTGNLILNAANTYTGPTNINAGTVTLNVAGAIPDFTAGPNAGAVYVQGTAGGTATLALGTQSLSLRTLNGGGAVTSAATGAGTLTVGNGDAGSAYFGVLSGGVHLVKTGAGTLTLGGTNTFTGGTDLNGGVIESYAAANFGPAATTSALNFNGGTLRPLVTYSFAGNYNWTIGAAGGTIDTPSSVNVTRNGVGLIGTGTLTKTGTGILSIGTNNSPNFTGTIQLNAGTLNLTNSSLQATTGMTVAAGATFRINDNAAAANTGTTFRLSTAGGTTLTLNGTGYGDGGAFRLVDQAGGTTGGPFTNWTTNVNLASTTQITPVNDVDITRRTTLKLSGVVSGVGGLTKTGTGNLLLTGNSNTYSGGTTVQEGLLMTGNTAGSATGTGSVTVAPGGALGGVGFVAPAAGNSVTINGGLTPGYSNFSSQQAAANTNLSPVGTLTVGSGTTPAVVNLNGTYQADLVTTTSDNLAVNGDLNIAPGAVLNVQGSTAQFDGTTVFTIASFTGNYNGGQFALTGTPLPAPYAVVYPAPGPGPGVIQISPVPEPAFVLLACGAVGGLGWWRRRRAAGA